MQNIDYMEFFETFHEDNKKIAELQDIVLNESKKEEILLALFKSNVLNNHISIRKMNLLQGFLDISGLISHSGHTENTTEIHAEHYTDSDHKLTYLLLKSTKNIVENNPPFGKLHEIVKSTFNHGYDSYFNTHNKYPLSDDPKYKPHTPSVDQLKKTFGQKDKLIENIELPDEQKEMIIDCSCLEDAPYIQGFDFLFINPQASEIKKIMEIEDQYIPIFKKIREVALIGAELAHIGYKKYDDKNWDLIQSSS